MSDINNIKIEPHLNIAFSRKQGDSVNAGKRIGILNRGRNTRIIDNKFSDLDIAIQDEGQDTVAKGNRVE